MTADARSGPLAGLRVIDAGIGTASIRASGLLADYGADVTWVERPGGAALRTAEPELVAVCARSKQSIELDLHSDAGRRDLVELLRSADVFLHSWRPGVADAMGLGFERLHAALPGLICTSISGFGDDDPNRDLAGHEAIVHAVVGTMGEQVGHRDGPIYEGLPFASIGAGYLAAIGTLGALHRRIADGAGRSVGTSMLDGALAYLAMMWSDDDRDSPPHAHGSRRLVARAFECADGEYLGIHTGAVGAFDRLMEVLGLAEHLPASGEGPAMGMELDANQRRIVLEELPKVLATRTCDEWLTTLVAADVCALPELRAGEVFDEAQVRHNEMVVRVDDAELGVLDQVSPPLRFSATPHDAPTRAPRPGEYQDADTADPWQDPAQGGDPDAETPLLEGVRILDLGAFFAGPYASRLLADLGADVIKVEPLHGDPLRGLERPFGSAQANKRAIALDLKQPEAQEIARRLAARVDIVQHNLRPGVAERLGLGYDDLRTDNPALIYAYAPGWGSSGPDIQRQSFAPLMSGYVGANFEVAGQFNPPLFPLGNEDPGNGLAGAAAMLIALLHRARGGSGQLVEHAQLNATMAHVAHIVRRADGEVLGAQRLDPLQFGRGALDRLYETDDGWICIVAASDREHQALGDALGIDLTGDDRFADANGRRDHDYQLADLVGTALSGLSIADALQRLRGAGVPAAVPAARNDAAFLRNPAQMRSGRVAECPHPTRGRVRETGVLVRVSGSTPPAHRLAPGLGEHTDEVLNELGLSQPDIDRLRAEGITR